MSTSERVRSLENTVSELCRRLDEQHKDIEALKEFHIKPNGRVKDWFTLTDVIKLIEDQGDAAVMLRAWLEFYHKTNNIKVESSGTERVTRRYCKDAVDFSVNKYKEMYA